VVESVYSAVRTDCLYKAVYVSSVKGLVSFVMKFQLLMILITDRRLRVCCGKGGGGLRLYVRWYSAVHEFWPVEISNGWLGASQCSDSVMFGLVSARRLCKYGWPSHTEVPSK
jgi:hypothetical protein